MAMGGKAQREITRAIKNCQPFQNSTGSMRGTRGRTRNLGWLSSHRERVRIKELLSRATYVVWSYDTPIGCVTEDEDGDVTKVYFDKSHTTTTSHHQSLVRVGFSDFETVGDGPWSRSVRPRPRSAMRAMDVRNTDPQPTGRYSDPDWTPWMSGGSNLPHGAEERDEWRVEREGRRSL